MNRYGIGSASYIEMLWTLVNAVGVLCCARLLLDALSDKRWLRENNVNGPRQILATESVIGELIYTVVMMLFAVVGVIAMFISSPSPDGRPFVVVAISSFVFILAAVAFTAHAYLRRYWREEFIRRREEKKRGQVTEPPMTVTIDTTDVDSVEITTQVTVKDPDEDVGPP